MDTDFSPDEALSAFADAVAAQKNNLEEAPKAEEKVETKEAAPKSDENLEVTDEELEAASQEEEPKEEPKKEEEKPKSRARERIQKLAQEKNSALETAQKLQAELQEQRRLQAEERTRMVAWAEQVKQQAIDEAKRAQAQRVEEENLSPVEKWEREVLLKARAEAEALAEQKYSALATKLQEKEQAELAAQEEAERKNRFHSYVSEAEQAADGLLKNYLPEHVTDDFKAETKNFLLTYSTGYGVTPAQAAKDFEKFFKRHNAALIKAKVQNKGAPQVKPKVPVVKGTGGGMQEASAPWNLEDHMDKILEPLRVK